MMRSLNPESYSIVAPLPHDIQHVQVFPKISTSGYASTVGDVDLIGKLISSGAKLESKNTNQILLLTY